MKVVGILTPKDGVNFGSLESGIYYTEALTEYMLDANKESEFINTFITPDLDKTSSFKQIKYNYSYYPADAFEGANLKNDATRTEVKDASMLTGTADSLFRSLGGNDVPNGVSIYPISFDDKYLVTAYLDKWNDKDLDITVNGNTIIGKDRQEVTYTDTL